MLKMIKEAQTTAKLGDKVDFYKNAQEALGVASLTEAVRILKENEDFGITPQQIHDQVHDYLAPQAGINPTQMTSRQFMQLAREFRVELEDHYDEVYGNGEWKNLVAQAWQIHTAPQGQENEEDSNDGFRAGYKGYGSNPHQKGSDDHRRWQDDYDMGRDQRDYDSREEDEESSAVINAGRNRLAAEERMRQQRAQRRSTEDDVWATRHIKDPLLRADTINSMEDEEMSNGALLAKLARVVKSVRTPEQYASAKKYADLVFNRIGDGIRDSKGFAGLGDTLSLQQDIKSELRGLRQRLWPVNSTDGQENEEAGWPSDESPEDEVSSAQYQGSLSGDEYDDLNADINQPWDDEDDLSFENEEFDRTEARAINRSNPNTGHRDLGSADEDRFAGAMRAVDHLYGSMAKRAKPWPKKEQENEESSMSQEQRGWDDAKAGRAPRFPNDTEYMTGHGRCSKLAAPKNGAENEEEGKSKGSLLKSLLSQRKEVSQKASEISKKYETEGAAAFHEIRMKHEKSPYCPQKQADEHSSWTKGWKKAAAEHYMPEEEDQKARAKAKAKTKAKPKR